jgi:uncharacterized SAM-binding protein YcdF (DUF218 family)
MLFNMSVSKHPDVIVILGGGTDGTLKPILYTKERVEAFLKLKSYSSVPIIVSGAYSAWLKKKPKFTEAEVMKEYLIRNGVPANNIFLEKRSKDTVGNAYYSKQIARKHHWKNILILTTKGHTARSKWVFGRVFGKAYNISMLGISTELQTFSKNPGRKKYENYLVNIYKNGLASCKDGDDKEILKVLRAFHPVYSKSKKAREILKQIIETKQKLLGYTKLK